MDHARVAKDVIGYVGGSDNITAAAHCATRLRLVLADLDKVDQKALDKDPDLKGTFVAGGMFQIIVGPGDVDIVFDEMVKSGVKEVSKDEAKQEAAKSGNLFSRFIKMIADIFVPILPALIAGGLMMALHNVLSAEGLFGDQSLVQRWSWLADYDSLINMVSAAAFAFLPILVGFSATKRFGGNVYLGGAMGAAMVSTSLLSAYDMAKDTAASNFWLYQGIGDKCSLDNNACIADLMAKGSIPAADAWNLFGLHVDKIGYQAMVIPVICMAFMLATIEKWLHKRLSGTADFLLTPLITILLTGFLTFVVVGPITRVLSIWITDGLNWMYTTLGAVGGLLFGLVYSPIVVTGLHQSFPAVEIPLLQGAGDLRPQGGFVEEVLDADSRARGLLGVCRPDAASRRADPVRAERPLVQAVKQLPIGSDDVRVRGDLQARRIDAAGGEFVDLLEEHARIHDDAVADHRRTAFREDPRGKEVERELPPADDDGVA